MSETLEEKFDLMKREVDALQIHIMESNTPSTRAASLSSIFRMRA